MPTGVPATGLAPLDANGRVAIDTPCANCGYNLRTLAADGLCPECAHPVYLSIGGNSLCFASPHWVKRLARGILYILIALGVAVVGSIAWLAACAHAIRLAQTTFPLMPANLALLFTGGLIGSMATAGLAIVGLLLITAREPGTQGRPQGATARRLIRIGLCLLPVAIVLGAITPKWPWGVADALLALSIPTAVVMVVAFGACWLITFVILPLALLRHVMILMKRIPRPDLARFTHFTVCLLLVALVLVVAANVIVLAAALSLGPRMAATTGSSTAPVVTTLPSGSSEKDAMVVQYPSTATSGQLTATTLPTPTLTARQIKLRSVEGTIGIASPILGAGLCGVFFFAIAAFILLIRVQRALAQAARLAEQNAAIAAAAVPATPSPPPAHPT